MFLTTATAATAAQASPVSILSAAACCEGLSGDLLLLAATVVQPIAHLEPDCTANEGQGLLLQW